MDCLAGHQAAQSLSPQAAHHPGTGAKIVSGSRGLGVRMPGAKCGICFSKLFSLFKPQFVHLEMVG